MNERKLRQLLIHLDNEAVKKEAQAKGINDPIEHAVTTGMASALKLSAKWLREIVEG